MILFVGQVGRDMREREAFQELDYRAVFGSIAKWVDRDRRSRADSGAGLARLLHRDQRPPGPVVVALPEDMLEERVDVADAPAFEPIETSPGAAEIDRMRQLLAAAERPIVIAGGSRWSEAASAALMRFAERFDIPVATSFRRTHVMDPLHPSYAGDLASGPNPKLLARVKAADLVLLIGGRLGEWPSQGYSLLDVPVPKQTLDPRASGHRGARSRLPAASRDPRHADRVRRCARPGRGAERHPLARRDQDRACRLPGVLRKADRGAGAGESRRDRRRLARCAAGRCGGHAPAPAISRSGCSASIAIANTARCTRRRPAPWATACRRPSP